MQAPIVIFDHIKKKVAAIQVSAAADKRTADLLAEQRKQVATSGRPKQK